jgi:PAS domain-containing protein
VAGRFARCDHGLAWIDLIHPDERDELSALWQAAIASGSPAIAGSRVRRASGEYRWMLHHTVPLRDDSGTIVRWFGSSVDIEDRKYAEGKIGNAEKELRTIIETYVWTATPDGAIDFSTESWFDRTGLGGDKAMGLGVDNVHEEDRERIIAA